MNRRGLLSLIPGLPFIGIPAAVPEPKSEPRLSDEDVERIAEAVAKKVSEPVTATAAVVAYTTGASDGTVMKLPSGWEVYSYRMPMK